MNVKLAVTAGVEIGVTAGVELGVTAGAEIIGAEILKEQK